MLNRRSFFQSIAKAAAIVALAPQLAFRVSVDPIKAPKLYPYQEELIEILTDRFTAEKFKDWMLKYYQENGVIRCD